MTTAGPLGFAFLEPAVDYFSGETHGHLGMIAVTRKRPRGAASARALMRAAEDWARAPRLSEAAPSTSSTATGTRARSTSGSATRSRPLRYVKPFWTKIVGMRAMVLLLVMALAQISSAPERAIVVGRGRGQRRRARAARDGRQHQQRHAQLRRRPRRRRSLPQGVRRARLQDDVGGRQRRSSAPGTSSPIIPATGRGSS